MFFWKKSGGALDFEARDVDQMSPKWVKYRCACAFEALETTIEAFKMIFCALKRSRIIFYDDEKRWVIWWVIGGHFYIIFRSLESIFIVFFRYKLLIRCKWLTIWLTTCMPKVGEKFFFVKHTNDSPFDSLFDPPSARMCDFCETFPWTLSPWRPNDSPFDSPDL